MRLGGGDGYIDVMMLMVGLEIVWRRSAQDGKRLVFLYHDNDGINKCKYHPNMLVGIIYEVQL